MKKFNKILSLALALVMTFSAVAILITPIEAGAVYTSDVSESPLSIDQIKEIARNAKDKKYATAEDMLKSEKAYGYLDSVKMQDAEKGIDNTIYVNRYTGVVYYVNNITGQILTSNPYNVGSVSGSSAQYELMSQLVVNWFYTKTSAEGAKALNSYEDAALRGQLSTESIVGGIRVNYTIGDTTTKYLLPMQITAERFESIFLKPAIDTFVETIKAYAVEHELDIDDSQLDFFNNDRYTSYEYGFINMSMTTGAKKYFTEALKLVSGSLTTEELATLNEIRNDITKITQYYNAKSKAKDEVYASPEQLENLFNLCPLTKEGIVVYRYNIEEYTSVQMQRKASELLRKYSTGYTYQDMYADEEYCKHKTEKVSQPVFRCSLEYTFNEDGSLSVALPAASIIYDESIYTIRTITPLMYFGTGDMSQYGYTFYPDGSGSIVNFTDFYGSSENIYMSSAVYGQDYCYSKISGKHKEQVSMPIFGVVNNVKTNKVTKTAFENNNAVAPDYVTNGYLAILEEGASLAELCVTSSGLSHNYCNAYAKYNPNPFDEFNLSDTISVGGLGINYVTAQSRYTGSYVTRYVMLTDPTVASTLLPGAETYSSSYVGMAKYYRDYLRDAGVLGELKKAEDSLSLPLYIELLGAIEIVKKVMTFPVNVSIPLTTFENVETIYSEFASAESTVREHLLAEADRYTALADAIQEQIDEYIKNDLTPPETETVLCERYRASAAEYAELAAKVKNVTNINFKLNGFTNGGLTATYPVKIKWESSCGGKRDFKALLDTAKAISAEAGKTFGVYPDFDFMYVNSTAAFDGISLKSTLSKMVDNRYASKQFYNSILSDYESFYNLVVSSDALDGLYKKFDKKYSKYDWNYLSVATLGSDVNSNFDKENPINREQALGDVKNLLSEMSSKYSLMTDKGNIYSIGYVDHIIDANIDSSHFSQASYAVPFWGLVLHGYVNYAGGALNYSGSPDYEILRAIENGASIYYILCYQNTPYLKEEAQLNKYYGISYTNWFDEIVKAYSELNTAIGGLQHYEIDDHRTVIAERAISAELRQSNLSLLTAEVCGFIKSQMQNKVNATYAAMNSGEITGYNGLRVSFDVAAVKAAVAADFFTDASELDSVTYTENGVTYTGFEAVFNHLVADYFAAEYPEAQNQYVVELTPDSEGRLYEYHYNDESSYTGEYKSRYRYVTDSTANDTVYRYTQYTTDSGNVVVVTYYDPVANDTVKFILNFNTFSVTVKLDGETYPVGAYGYERID